MSEPVHHLEGVVADVVLLHLLADQLLVDDALVDALAQQPEEERLLVRIRMGPVVPDEGVVAEHLAPRAQDPADGREDPVLLRRG